MDKCDKKEKDYGRWHIDFPRRSITDDATRLGIFFYDVRDSKGNYWFSEKMDSFPLPFLIKYLVYWRDRPFSLPSKLRMFNHFLLHIFIHAYRSSHAKVLRKKDVLKNYFLLRSALNNLSGHYDPSFLSSRPLHTYHPINSFSHGSGTILRKIHINTYLMTDHIAGTDHLLKASLYNSFITPYIYLSIC